MKKVFTLLTLLLTVCSGAWAADAVSATQTYTNAGSTCTWTSVSAIVKNTTPFGADGLLFQTVSEASNGIKMGDSNASLKIYEINDVVYVQVASASSHGSITVKANGNNNNRKLALLSGEEIPMVTAGKTVDFVATDVVEVGGLYYIKLTYSANETAGKEYKLLSAEPFSVTLEGETFPGYVSDANTPVIDTNLDAVNPYEAQVGIGLNLTIEASHAYTYQWYSCDDKTGTNPVAIEGATAATYTFVAADADELTTKYFYCVATNGDASGEKNAQSNIATVNVLAKPVLTAVTRQIWNIADFDNFTYTTAAIVNNLELKNATIDGGNKTMDGFTLSKRIKINKDETATNRYVKFKIGGPCIITVYGMSGSSSQDRVLGINIDGTEVTTLTAGGTDMAKVTYTYTGTEEAEVVLFCKEGSGTFNIHGITVSDVVVNISAYEWSTFVSDQALAFDGIADLEVYIVTGRDNATLLKDQMTGTVAANTPLLVKGTANAKYYIPLAGTVSPVAGNLLKAGDGSAVAAEDGKTKYVLSVNAGAAAFKKIVSGKAATVAAGKAYLQFEEDIEAREFFNLDEESTGISATLKNSEKVNGEYYDLQGRRIAQPTKGLYIVNGKKVIIK